MKPHTISLSLVLLLLVPNGKPENGAFQQKDAEPAVHVPTVAASIQANVDYGAQLLLIDQKGNRTGYDASTGQLLHQIAGASYVDDSVSDESDDSDNAVTAEARVLRIPPGTYLLKVVPGDRQSYRIQFSCTQLGKHSQLAGENISILPGEEHGFSLDSGSGCAGAFAAGALPAQAASPGSLLSFGFPLSSSVHLQKGARLHIVIIYGNHVLPANFAATLNGESLADVFHPKPGRIESVSIAVRSGHNVLNLTAYGDHSSTSSAFSFAVEAE